MIDSAILWSGSLEKHVYLELPDGEKRAEILAYHFDHPLYAEDLREITDRLRLITHAGLEELAPAAKRTARLRKYDLPLSGSVRPRSERDVRARSLAFSQLIEW